MESGLGKLIKKYDKDSVTAKEYKFDENGQFPDMLDDEEVEEQVNQS